MASPYNQMFKQFNNLQRKMEEDKKNLENKLFTKKKAGDMITIEVLGSKKIKQISIKEEFYKDEDPETITSFITKGINELIEEIDKEEQKILSTMGNIPGLSNFLR